MDRIRIYAKSADSRGNKEPLAEHTIHDIVAAIRLVANLPFSYWKKQRILHDLIEAVAYHDVARTLRRLYQYYCSNPK